MRAKRQIEILKTYIVEHTPRGLSTNECVGETAIRLLDEYRVALWKVMNELGVPNEAYLTLMANAYEIAKKALG